MCSFLFSCGRNFDFSTGHCENLQHSLDTTFSACPEPLLINNHDFYQDFIVEEMSVVTKLLRQKWFCLQTAVTDNEILSAEELTCIREDINAIFKSIVYCILKCESESLKQEYNTCTRQYLNTFEPLVTSVTRLEDSVLAKLYSNTSKQRNSPEYHYFHTYLEIGYYLLIYDYVSGNDVRLRLEKLTRDLFCLSKRPYNQKSNDPFVCDCQKAMWLAIQIFSEKVNTVISPRKVSAFWELFNEVSEEHEPGFVLWLLKYVADVQGIGSNGQYTGASSDRIQPNFPMLEASLKKVLPCTESCEVVLFTLKCVEPLVGTLWMKHAKIEVYQSIWEYFSKRLNRSEDVNLSQTLEELIERVDKILWTSTDYKCEFDLFLALMVNHLSVYPQHWSKMKGRIYTQLGPNKIKDLNHVGIFRVLLMFVSLTKVNADEAAGKFVAFVECLPFEKRHSQIVWTFYMLLIVRHVRENRSIAPVTPLILRMLDEATNDHNYSHLMKTFCKHFDIVIKNSTNLQLQQASLIGNWMYKYMSTCYYEDLVLLLQILTNTIDRIISDQVWSDWDSVYKDCVFYSLKNLCNAPSVPVIAGLLAAKITLQNSILLDESFLFFNGDSMPPGLTSNYLCGILDDPQNALNLSEDQKNVAVRSWTRICLFTKDKYDQLTKNMLKLAVFPEFAVASMRTSNDPLNALIHSISVNITSDNVAMLNKLCENCFGNVEQWICSYFAQPESEAIVLRVLTLIALVFFKVGKLTYDKRKNTTFSRFFPSVLLPAPVMTAKPLNPYVLNSVKKTWHLFFEAAVKLNTSNDDRFIDRVLKDMVTRYLPYFGITDSPMLKSLDNEKISGVILEKMAISFLKQPTSESESNVSKCLRIINCFTEGTSSLPCFKMVVEKTLFGMFEIVMFHCQKNTALTVIKTVTCSQLYSEVKPDVEVVVVQLTEKHLPFNAVTYFQLMNVLGKFMRNDVKSWVPKIKQRISYVEKMRGVGYDTNLRTHLNKLEETL